MSTSYGLGNNRVLTPNDYNEPMAVRIASWSVITDHGPVPPRASDGPTYFANEILPRFVPIQRMKLRLR